MVARFVSRFCSALSPSSRMAAATSPLRRGDVERWWVGLWAPPPRAPTFVAQCRSPRLPLEGHLAQSAGTWSPASQCRVRCNVGAGRPGGWQASSFVRPRARSGSVPRSEHIARVRIDGLPRETCDAHQRIYHDIEHRRNSRNPATVALGALGRPTEALAVYDEVTARYGEDPTSALREVVARAVSALAFGRGSSRSRITSRLRRMASFISTTLRPRCHRERHSPARPGSMHHSRHDQRARW